MPNFVHRITEISAQETLNTRGGLALQVSVTLADGARGHASVPLGASASSLKAAVPSSGKPHRYAGPGVQHAAESALGQISNCLVGPWWPSLSQIDAAMTELDDSPDWSQIGADAIVGVSMACARALAQSADTELWQWLAPHGVPPRLPLPLFSVVNGDVRNANCKDFQEIMITPLGAPALPAAFQAGRAVYGVLRSLLAGKGYSIRLGDQVGLAPQTPELEDFLELLMTAIAVAGYEPGLSGIAISMDPAASRSRQSDGRYRIAGKTLSTTEMIEWYTDITERFPVWLIKDGLAIDDWDGWAELTSRLGHRVRLAGDAIFMTSPGLIAEATAKGVGNAAMIRLNQAGTVTHSLRAMAACRHGNYAQLISHWPNKTSDTFAADLAISSGSVELKAGTSLRGERTATYDRLLDIAAGQPQMAYGPQLS